MTFEHCFLGLVTVENLTHLIELVLADFLLLNGDLLGRTAFFASMSLVTFNQLSAAQLAICLSYGFALWCQETAVINSCDSIKQNLLIFLNFLVSIRAAHTR